MRTDHFVGFVTRCLVFQKKLLNTGEVTPFLISTRISTSLKRPGRLKGQIRYLKRIGYYLLILKVALLYPITLSDKQGTFAYIREFPHDD